MESQQLARLLLCTKSFSHDFVPHATAGAELCHFFKEVVVAVPEERQAWCEIIDIETCINRCLNICNCICQRKCNFLNSRTASFTNVIPRDRNGVPFRNVLRAIRKNISNDAHRRTRWVHVCTASDVFLQQVVLNCSANGRRRHTLLFCNQFIHQQQNCSS